MIKLIEEFAETVRCGSTEIYNEFSLQHEIGIYLRSRLVDQKVQFERNVHFFFKSGEFIKREIDITIFSADKSRLLCAIELKFPRQGQHPEQMFSFCKDILFVEQLKRSGFERTFLMTFVDDPLFYSSGARRDGIYAYFRKGQELSGTVQKPTKMKGAPANITLSGSYKVHWTHVLGDLKYFVVEAASG